MCERVNVSVQQQWDWTVAMDDAFSERFHHCFLCGHRAQWHEIREVTGAWVVGLCVRCLSSAGWAAVEARLRERYGRDMTTSMNAWAALPQFQHEKDSDSKATSKTVFDRADAGFQWVQSCREIRYRFGCFVSFLFASAGL
jgi:hypothetical protein